MVDANGVQVFRHRKQLLLGQFLVEDHGIQKQKNIKGRVLTLWPVERSSDFISEIK